MALRDQPLSTTEFLVVDVETTGHGGDGCELTEVGAVLVGGGSCTSATSRWCRCAARRCAAWSA